LVSNMLIVSINPFLFVCYKFQD